MARRRGRTAALIAIVTLLVVWLVASGMWVRWLRAPFHVHMAGFAQGWSLKGTGTRQEGGDMTISLLVERSERLPRSFAWELAMPGQGVTCRGIATVPDAVTSVGLSPCRMRWIGSSADLNAQWRAGWFGIVWYAQGHLQEVRFALQAEP